MHIIDCAQDACLYLGLNRSVTKRELKKVLEEDALEEMLNRVLLKPGDTYVIPPATLHGIGPGVLAAQVFRSGLQRHRVKASPAAEAQHKLTREEREKGLRNVSLEPGKAVFPERLRYFAGEDYTLKIQTANGQHSGYVGPESFAALLILDGSGILHGRNTHIPFYSADTLFLGANSGEVTIEGICDYLVVRIPKAERKKARYSWQQFQQSALTHS